MASGESKSNENHHDFNHAAFARIVVGGPVEVLADMMQRDRSRREIHNQAALHWAKLHLKLNVPRSILNSLIAGGTISTIVDSLQKGEDHKRSETGRIIVLLIAGIVFLITLVEWILSQLIRALNPAEHSKLQRERSTQYSRIINMAQGAIYAIRYKAQNHHEAESILRKVMHVRSDMHDPLHVYVLPQKLQERMDQLETSPTYIPESGTVQNDEIAAENTGAFPRVVRDDIVVGGDVLDSAVPPHRMCSPPISDALSKPKSQERASDEAESIPIISSHPVQRISTETRQFLQELYDRAGSNTSHLLQETALMEHKQEKYQRIMTMMRLCRQLATAVAASGESSTGAENPNLTFSVYIAAIVFFLTWLISSAETIVASFKLDEHITQNRQKNTQIIKFKHFLVGRVMEMNHTNKQNPITEVQVLQDVIEMHQRMVLMGTIDDEGIRFDSAGTPMIGRRQMPQSSRLLSASKEQAEVTIPIRSQKFQSVRQQTMLPIV